MGSEARRRRPPLLGRLDEGTPTRTQCVLLVGVAAALAWYWLPAIVTAFVRTVVEGQETMPPPRIDLGIAVRSILANAIIAFLVGALAGSGVRRFRWAVGPTLLLLTAAYDVLAVLSAGNPTLTMSVLEDSVRVQVHLQAHASRLVWLLCLLTCTAIGGHLARRIFHRLPLSLVVTGALGWICVAFVASIIEQVWSSRYYNVTYSSWSMADLALKTPGVLPYILGGAWMRLAMRDTRLWRDAVVVGAAAAMQVFRGYVGLVTTGTLSALLLYGSWCLQPIVWASVGAWVGGLVLGLESRGEQLRQAAAVLVAGAIAAAIGLLASSTQVGILAP